MQLYYMVCAEMPVRRFASLMNSSAATYSFKSRPNSSIKVIPLRRSSFSSFRVRGPLPFADGLTCSDGRFCSSLSDIINFFTRMAAAEYALSQILLKKLAAASPGSFNDDSALIDDCLYELRCTLGLERNTTVDKNEGMDIEELFSIDVEGAIRKLPGHVDRMFSFQLSEFLDSLKGLLLDQYDTFAPLAVALLKNSRVTSMLRAKFDKTTRQKLSREPPRNPVDLELYLRLVNPNCGSDHGQFPWLFDCFQMAMEDTNSSVYRIIEADPKICRDWVRHTAQTAPLVMICHSYGIWLVSTETGPKTIES